MHSGMKEVGKKKRKENVFCGRRGGLIVSPAGCIPCANLHDCMYPEEAGKKVAL